MTDEQIKSLFYYASTAAQDGVIAPFRERISGLFAGQEFSEVIAAWNEGRPLPSWYVAEFGALRDQLVASDAFATFSDDPRNPFVWVYFGTVSPQRFDHPVLATLVRQWTDESALSEKRTIVHVADGILGAGAGAYAVNPPNPPPDPQMKQYLQISASRDDALRVA